jgi:hypothetical protein
MPLPTRRIARSAVRRMATGLLICYNNTMSSKTLSILAVLLGVVFLVLAFIYWLTPANALPTYLPGYDASLATVHVKHGVAAFLLALASFVFAWFKSGKKSAGQ